MRLNLSPRAALLTSISVLAVTVATPTIASAQVEVEELIITATRRNSTVQDAPINIAAVGAVEMQKQGLTDLSDVAKWVPGIHIVDQGSRSDNRIIVRGLNADPLGSDEGVTAGGGTVATYVGEIPLYVDLRTNDLERVEILLGPQGTLYGAGTLGGAIRYIPNRPDFTAPMMEVRADAYQYSEAASLSGDFGVTFNAPLSDTFALRASFDRLQDSGFVDYNFLVQRPGISDPDPDFSDPSAVAQNLKHEKDANYEDVTSGRLAARWAPTDWLDGTLTYHFQDKDVGARQVSHRRSTLATGDYEAAGRVLEPNERWNELLALEVTADLGFAQLTSSTGKSRYTERGQRDQTDLLISLEYSYEAFPTFTAYTQEEAGQQVLSQEVRLVSDHEGPFSWILGGFYYELDSNSSSKEFTPGYAEWLGGNRPDALEYYNVNLNDLKEQAIYGEVSYEITPAWQVTVGARRYSYELETFQAVDFPLLNSVFFGAGPDEINLAFEPGGQEDDGWLYKFNTSYQFTDDILGYLTVSEGYRIGNSNGVGPCPDPLPTNQISCALPNELAYQPDKTLNYEVGLKTQLFDNRLTLNGSAYFIEWSDPQVSSATENGLIPITKNGSAAESKGVEINFIGQVTGDLTVRGSYSYNTSELTEVTPNLVPRFNPPGFQSTITYEDGMPGDRLPGSPEHQGSLFIDYERPLANGMNFGVNYGVTALGDVLTRTGGRAESLTLEGYQVHNAAVSLSTDAWTATLYVKNLFNEFAETGARATSQYNQPVFDGDGDPVYVRSYYTYVLPPRAIGVRFTRKFGG
ncbi:TonB-dependent receptor [Phenylobacterium sp.]|uniref:TonB-dependent receptor n=3 Tax=Phenylobacterium sp. TaxID=1871053 RepID=UPI00272FE97D|nr:TonB-dependent receptor [Phenylobacterium sp.]MDP1617371.1 TonB-dependent receptor [Phenylobacterium sp.]